MNEYMSEYVLVIVTVPYLDRGRGPVGCTVWGGRKPCAVCQSCKDPQNHKSRLGISERIREEIRGSVGGGGGEELVVSDDRTREGTLRISNARMTDEGKAPGTRLWRTDNQE